LNKNSSEITFGCFDESELSSSLVSEGTAHHNQVKSSDYSNNIPAINKTTKTSYLDVPTSSASQKKKYKEYKKMNKCDYSTSFSDAVAGRRRKSSIQEEIHEMLHSMVLEKKMNSMEEKLKPSLYISMKDI
jgi:uncharacterized Zn finger protein (UPF0148 family)